MKNALILLFIILCGGCSGRTVIAGDVLGTWDVVATEQIWDDGTVKEWTGHRDLILSDRTLETQLLDHQFSLGIKFHQLEGEYRIEVIKIYDAAPHVADFTIDTLRELEIRFIPLGEHAAQIIVNAVGDSITKISLQRPVTNR